MNCHLKKDESELMKLLVNITDPTEDHLTGKKKPWEGRSEYSNWAMLYLLATRMIFILIFLLLIIINKNYWWIWIFLLIANLWIYGETFVSKEKYYRIGLYDGTRQAERRWKG